MVQGELGNIVLYNDFLSSHKYLEVEQWRLLFQAPDVGLIAPDLVIYLDVQPEVFCLYSLFFILFIFILATVCLYSLYSVYTLS